MTYLSRKKYRQLGLYKPLTLKNNRVIFEEVGGGRPIWYGVTSENRDFRHNYDTVFINSLGNKETVLDESFLSEEFKKHEYRPMFLGEFAIKKLYNALVPYKDSVLLDRDKFCGGDYSQLTEHFDKLVGGITINNAFYAFITHDQYIDIIEGRPLPKYLRDFFKSLGMYPPKDYLLC